MIHFKSLFPFRTLKILSSIMLLNIFIFCSCVSTMKFTLGIKKFKPISHKKIIEISERYNLGKYTYGYVDTNYYHFIESKTESNKVISSALQPLNLMLFDSNKNYIASVVNCDARFKFINMNWDNSYKYFPPSPIEQYKNKFPKDLTILDSIQKHIFILKEIQDSKITNPNFYAFIFWSKAMGRQSSIFINQTLAYLKNKNIQITLVNIDNILGYAKQ